jgi:hypothetical protein
MKTLDSDNGRLGRELADLQGRLALGERTEKESRREALGLRQRLLKGESSLEALKQEVTGQEGGLARGGWVTAGLTSLQSETLSVVLVLTTERTVDPMCADRQKVVGRL